jgi:flavin reductase (DIM6/NTAB) family NADH-FMN oxidoreductase RutF/uncharacterized protein YciI
MPKVAFPGDFSPLAGPIALVTTVDTGGRVNVAPKSWISHVCREPDLLVLGCSRTHHTARNLLANGECVLNFPSDALAQQAWDAHRFLDPCQDELAIRGFAPVPAEKVAPPRLEQCRAHIEGRVESVKWYGDECIFFIEQVARSVDAEVAAAPDPYALIRPIFYLGPGTYGAIDHACKVSVQGQGDDFTRYVILLTPRPGVALTEPLIRAHVAHLRQLDAAGRLVLCGPFGDGSGGMVIIRAGSLDEARAIAAADPFVAAEAEDFTVRPWHLSCDANNHMGFGD